MAERSKKNPWHGNAGDRGNVKKGRGNTSLVNEAPTRESANARFQEASAKMQASVQRHIQEYESSSEEEELEEAKILDSVSVNFKINPKDVDLGRTKEFLEQSFQSGAVICLVCIGSVKRAQPIWNCESCYTAFHLQCIQRWARDTIFQQSQASAPNLGELPVRDTTFQRVQWCCPKCRSPYNESQVPNNYECFCKKKINPEFEPWYVPHSCGEMCNKPLSQQCKHRCLLLCHPGPCPPCPQMITVTCNCQQSAAKAVRCSVSTWCCTRVCNKLLDCNKHRCDKICHAGDCDPCGKYKQQACQCKASTDKILCSQTSWQCKKVCGKSLTCGYHICEQVCHKTICGQCPFTGFQKCPCGAVEKEVVCPSKVSSCEGNCNKLLDCAKHVCPHKCHKDKCPPCLEIVDKPCHCGLHVKQLPCSKQYMCETKCRNMRECGRHPCKRKCCQGDCAPCDKECGRRLQCGQHRCASACHRGPCYPCAQTAPVTCFCARTSILVPCGRQKKTKPPNCSLNCRIPMVCNHAKENTHKCHFGSCPLCKEKCGKILSCGHVCVATCHISVPVVLSTVKAATPYERQMPKIEVRSLPCPPCTMPVKRSCLGLHEEISWPCHSARVTSCGRMCGRVLGCTNHKCSKECHPVPIESVQVSDQESVECEKCTNQCSLPRPVGCSHPCTKQCHPPPCLPCSQFLKRTCHCGLTELFLQCDAFTSTNAIKKEESLSCKQQCIKLLNCGHRCYIICHSGTCPTDKLCSRKTKVCCPCLRIKKDIACNLAQEYSISCDDACKKKQAEDMQIQEEEKRKKIIEEQIRNDREIAEYERKFGKKKYKQRKVIQSENKASFWIKYRVFIISIFVLFVAIFLFIYFK